MSDEKLLTIREVSQYLDMSEKEVIDLAESQALPAYKIGGVYLRFKRHQVEEFKKQHKTSAHKKIALKANFGERVSDFFYFNDFYILSGLIITIILVVIFRGF